MYAMARHPEGSTGAGGSSFSGTVVSATIRAYHEAVGRADAEDAQEKVRAQAVAAPVQPPPLPCMLPLPVPCMPNCPPLTTAPVRHASQEAPR